MTAYKMTPDRLKRIYEAIELGLPYKLAAQYGGITESSFHAWKAAAATETEPGPYTAFVQGIEAAEGRCAVRCMATIQQAAKKGHWQAAAWTLERRFDVMRMPAQRVELSGPEGSTLKVETFSATLAEQLRDAPLDRLRALAGLPDAPEQLPEDDGEG